MRELIRTVLATKTADGDSISTHAVTKPGQFGRVEAAPVAALRLSVVLMRLTVAGQTLAIPAVNTANEVLPHKTSRQRALGWLSKNTILDYTPAGGNSPGRLLIEGAHKEVAYKDPGPLTPKPKPALTLTVSTPEKPKRGGEQFSAKPEHTLPTDRGRSGLRNGPAAKPSKRGRVAAEFAASNKRPTELPAEKLARDDQSKLAKAAQAEKDAEHEAAEKAEMEHILGQHYDQLNQLAFRWRLRRRRLLHGAS